MIVPCIIGHWQSFKKNKKSKNKLKININRLIEEKEKFSKLEKNLKVEKDDNDQIIENLKNILADNDDKIESLRKELSEVSEAKHTNLALKKSLKGQKEFYAELLESKEGFPHGTKYVLENPRMFPQVLGTVADMFHVEERYRDALEVGLGDLSHSLITKDRSTAIKILQKANEVNAGDLTIIPLEEALKLKKDLKSPPKLGKKSIRASELVQTSKELKPLADYILGNLFIIDQIDSELNNHSMIEYNIVDLAGNFSGNDLVIKHRKHTEHGNVIGRKEKLDLILHEIDLLTNKQIKLDKKSKIIESSLNELHLNLQKNKDDLERANQLSSKIESDFVRSQLMLKQIKSQIDSGKKYESEIAIEIKTASKSAKKIEPTVNNAEKA